VVAVTDGAGVTTGDGDVVGTTVGCGVVVLGAGLVGVIRAVGLGVVAGRDVGGTALGEVEGCVGAGETVAARCGLNSR
jgi:hypothetical protein